MSENKPSLAEIDGQSYRSHETKKARHVHKRIIEPKDPQSNPVKDYFLQKNRIRIAHFTEDQASLITDPKKVERIDDMAKEDYENGMRAQEEINLAKEKAENLKYDGLTKEFKVFTRGSGDIAFQTAINDALRNKQGIGLLMVDHDHFKDVNDRHGHPVGDTVLKTVAENLRRLTRRRNDFILRYGGEEFCVVLPAITPDKLWEKADSTELIYDQQQEELRADNPVFNTHRTMSRGITYLDPKDPEIQGMTNGEILQLMYKRADDALYAAKEMGRNQTQDYSEIDDRFKKNTGPKSA